MQIEIQLSEIEEKIRNGYVLIDMRDEVSIQYGMIPGAVPLRMENLLQNAGQFRQHPGVIIYCTRGENSIYAAEELREENIPAYSLAGGYNAWLRERMQQEIDTNSVKKEEIERGIQKRWHKKLFSPFAKAVKTYDMLQDGDKIAVCISGGKDSMLMAKLFQELKIHNKFDFEVKFLVMDPGYSPANRKVIEENARKLNIPITIFESDIFDSVYNIEKSPCYLCARMRRGHLYHFAQELGCNKIALGHHYDDVIETILMGMLYGAQIQTMMPKLHSTNFEGMELIRPLYFVKEEDILNCKDYNGLHFLQCACRFTEQAANEQAARGIAGNGADIVHTSKRQEMKELIRSLRKISPFIDANIMKSVENINLDACLGYVQKGVRHHFMDKYDER